MTTRRETGHLLRRAGFGPTPSSYDEFASLSWSDAVDRLVDYESTPDTLPADPTPTQMSGQGALVVGVQDALFWWMDRMLRTERPLEERMTLFWHDHFATAISKAPPGFMAGQNKLLREMAMGNFGDLLRAIATDPAMMLYLDNARNVAGSPNENYARELLELHTLGQGNYTETDIKEIARALTGWVVRGRGEVAADDIVEFASFRHDDGLKTIFGQTGNYDLDDVIDLVLQQPALPKFIAGKIACWFIGDEPSTTLVDSLADQFVETGFEVRPLARSILNSTEFQSDDAYRSRVKAPVEFAVGAARGLGAQSPPRFLVRMSERMGQMILNPPSPAGWPSGDVWVNGNTALLRSNFAMVAASMPLHDNRDGVLVGFDPSPLLDATGAYDAATVLKTFTDILYDGEIDPVDEQILLDYLGDLNGDSPGAPFATLEAKVRGLVYLILSSPVYALS